MPRKRERKKSEQKTTYFKMNKKDIEAQNILVEEKFKKNRGEWGSKILDLIRMIRDMSKVTEAHVLMLSYRHVITDLVAELQNTLHKRNGSYDNYFKIKYVEYSTGYSLKLNGGEKEKFVKADLSALRRQIAMMESHLNFYEECKRTLDNMGFALKNRITLHQEEI